MISILLSQSCSTTPVASDHEKELVAPCERPRLRQPNPTIRDAINLTSERKYALIECDCRMAILRKDKLPPECLKPKNAVTS